MIGRAWATGTLRAPSTWPTFAEEIQGTFLDGRGTRNPTILGEVEDWNIAFIASAARGFKQTLATIPYTSRDGFEFRLRPVTVLGRILRRLVSPPALTGVGGFDREFSMRTNDGTMLRALLASQEVRGLIRRHALRGSMHLEARRELFTEDRYELRFWVERIVAELEELRGIHALLRETLRQMQRLGSVDVEA